MQQFKYYKRGEGELDSSNFQNIYDDGSIILDDLTYRDFMSLCILDEWLNRKERKKFIEVIIKGYVPNLRGDKDLGLPNKIYDKFQWLDFTCMSVQHENTNAIKTALIKIQTITKDFPELGWDTRMFVGADSSVPKFCPEITNYAEKVRFNAKVTHVSTYQIDDLSTIANVIIVDDILGGGATVQMLIDNLNERGYKGNYFLWTQYNEAIHSFTFLNQFKSTSLGAII